MKIGKKEISLIKVLLIMIFIIMITIFIFIIIRNNKKYTSIEDFDTIKEVVEYMGSEYIDDYRTNSSYKRKVELKFKYLPYNEDKTSNENYYNQMIGFIAEVIGYSNFILHDAENEIEVRVQCDPNNRSVVNVNINNIDNYFSVNDNTNAISSYTKVNNIDTIINSVELIKLINNNWGYSEELFGTKDSYYSNYDIFFDEGIETRVIKNEILTDESETDINKVFNIVFTKKYNKSVINNLYTNSGLAEVINILGEPQFGSKDNGLIGYKSDKMYIFFTGSQISIYRLDSPDKTTFAKIVTKFIEEKNSKDLISDLVNIWPDYDNSTNNMDEDSRSLTYTLYGIKVQFNITNEHGIILYNDFSGNVTEDVTFEEILNKTKEIPKYVYVKNTSLVYENEIMRAFSYTDTKYMKQTSKFVAVPTYLSTDTISIKFMSLTDEYPNSELANNVYTYEWADDIHFIYSRKGQGIYLYNVVTKEEKTIIEGTDNYEITNYENNTLTYDGKTIKIDL